MLGVEEDLAYIIAISNAIDIALGHPYVFNAQQFRKKLDRWMQEREERGQKNFPARDTIEQHVRGIIARRLMRAIKPKKSRRKYDTQTLQLI